MFRGFINLYRIGGINLAQGYVYDFRAVITFGLPVWIIIRIVTIFIRIKAGKKILIGKEIMTNIFALYCLLLVGVTLFPIELMFGEGVKELRSIHPLKQRLGINIIPLREIINGIIRLKDSDIGYSFLIRDILGNFILLSPFIGYLLMYKKAIRSLKNVTMITIVISVSIELLQLLENIACVSGMQGRTVNIDDLILNTISGLLAYCIFELIYKTKLRIYLNMD